MTSNSEAYRVVQKAVRDGTLQKQPCEICGSEESEAHHDDYEQPLKVKWLCRKHHAEIPKERHAILDERKPITLNLRVELVNMIDEIAREIHTKRPGALEVAVGKEYKAIMRKRAQQFPTLAQVEAKEGGENGNAAA